MSAPFTIWTHAQNYAYPDGEFYPLFIRWDLSSGMGTRFILTDSIEHGRAEGIVGGGWSGGMILGPGENFECPSFQLTRHDGPWHPNDARRPQ